MQKILTISLCVSWGLTMVWTVLKDVLNFWNKMTIDYQRKSLILYMKIILCLTFENRLVGEKRGGSEIVWFGVSER